MTRRKKQLLSLFLCVLMLLSLFPAAVFAEEGEAEANMSEPVTTENADLTADEGILPEDGGDGADDEQDAEPETPEEDVPESEDLSGEDADFPDDGDSIVDPPDDGGEDTYAGGDMDAGADEDLDETGNPDESDVPAADQSDSEDTSDGAQNTDALSGTVDASFSGEGAGDPADEMILYFEDEPVWGYDSGPYDGEELLKAYAQQRLNSAKGGMLRASFYAGRKLNSEDPVQGSIYFLLKDLVSEVVSGERTSTTFTGPISDLTQYGAVTQTRFTAAELGLTTIDSSNVETAKTLAKERAGLEGGIDAAITALLADCAYELYWFDKTAGWSSGYSYARASSGAYIEIVGYTYFLSVAQDYALDGDTGMVSNAHTARIDTAIATARQIVQDAADCSTMEKLDYYRTAICDRVEYNYAAANNSSTPYGDPWQLIWVFDEDPETNVVCEGYSKAFQYLCELTQFSDSVRCCSVTGTMNGGPHMWNIVGLDSGNYLADVTNCDYGSSGWPTELFLTGYDSGSLDEGYSFLCGSKSIQYIYDDSTTGNFSAADLTLVQKENAGTVSILIVLTSEGDCGESVGLLTGGGRYSPDDIISISASEVEGYTFLGWYKSNGQLFTANPSPRFKVSGTVHLIARYEGTGMATLRVSNAEVSVNGETCQKTENLLRFLRGTQVSVRYLGDETRFVRWCNDSGMTVGTSATISFNLLRDVSLRAVVSGVSDDGTTEGSQAFVEFVSDYGQVVSASVWNSLDSAEDCVLPEGPARTGRAFRAWSADGHSGTDAAGILSLIDGSTRHLQIRPLYTVTGETCTITVEQNGQIQTFNVIRGGSVTVTAEPVDGKVFHHWENESGTVLGTGVTYSLMAAGDYTLRAVYVDAGSGAEAVPVLAVTGVDPVSDGGVHRIAFRVTRSIPEGYMLNQLLLMVTDDAAVATEDNMLVGKGVPQAVATVTGLTGTLTVNKRAADDSTVYYARGYMLVTDADGAETEIYTPIFSGCYQDLVG